MFPYLSDARQLRDLLLASAFIWSARDNVGIFAFQMMIDFPQITCPTYVLTMRSALRPTGHTQRHTRRHTQSNTQTYSQTDTHTYIGLHTKTHTDTHAYAHYTVIVYVYYLYRHKYM